MQPPLRSAEKLVVDLEAHAACHVDEEPLPFADDLLEIETLPIVITPDGKTLVDDSGEPVHCAMNWRNKDAFLDLVTQQLIGGAL